MDDWLVGRFEKFAHKFQRLTGKTNFWLAKWNIVIGTTFFWLALIQKLETLEGAVVATVFALAFGVYCAWREEKKEINFFSKKISCLNEERASLLAMSVRISWLYLSFFNLNMTFATGIYSLATYSLIAGCLGWTMACYLGACTPLPPGQSKIRKLINKLSWAINDKLAPEPVPESS